MIKVVYDEKTKTWKEWKKGEKPYATIGAESVEALEYLDQRIEKQKAKKPLGVDWHEKESGNIHLWVCPICEIFFLGRRMADEKKSFHPNYCPRCGQKIDWSDIE